MFSMERGHKFDYRFFYTSAICTLSHLITLHIIILLEPDKDGSSQENLTP